MPVRASRASRAAAALLALALAPGLAAASSTAADVGSAWIDPDAPAQRPPRTADISPVNRASAVDTLATVRQRGVIRVGVVQVPPMVMQDSRGGYVGYSVDIARRLAADLGVDVEFVETSWKDVIPELIEGRSDLVATGLWMNVPRALVVNFTQPTAEEELHLLADRRRAGTRRTLPDFDDPRVTVAVPPDPLQQRVAKARLPRAKLLVVEGDPLAVVAEGRADAALLATLSAEAVVAWAPGRWFLPAGAALARTSAAIAVRKGDADWLSFLDTWLAIQREQGWLAERARHWAVSTEGFE